LLPPSPRYVSAAYTAGPPKRWLVTFDQDITWQDPAADPANWYFTQSFIPHYGTAVSLSGGRVRIDSATFTGAETRITYAGPPTEFASAGGTVIRPFTQKPL
jgi:hypothetical protein